MNTDDDKRFAIAANITAWAMLVSTALLVADTWGQIGGSWRVQVPWEFAVLLGLCLASGLVVTFLPIAANIERIVLAYFNFKRIHCDSDDSRSNDEDGDDQ